MHVPCAEAGIVVINGFEAAFWPHDDSQKTDENNEPSATQAGHFVGGCVFAGTHEGCASTGKARNERKHAHPNEVYIVFSADCSSLARPNCGITV
jgi:hypothetical protein